MNNNDTKKQKGFSFALYVCLGVVLVGGAMLAAYLTGENNEVVPVSTIGTSPVGMAGAMPMPSAPPAQPAPLPARPATPAPARPVTPQQTAPAEETGIREFFNIGEEGGQPQAQPAEPAPTPTETTAVPVAEAVPVFNHFVEGNTMTWPVVGEVVMDYSTDAFVYDPVLEVFRTNDTMRISSPQGSTVRAVAEGLVTDIAYERRYGTLLTIDHGNGWATTYSQLGDIVVSLGDVVVAGQIIAEVGEPSIFTSALGDNLGFRVSYHDSTVNPLTVLAQ